MTFLPFKPLAEVAQEQLQRAMVEMGKLEELAPLMQAMTQASTGISGAQATLKKMNDMLVQGTKTMKAAATRSPPPLRDSTASEASVRSGTETEAAAEHRS